MDLEDHHLLFHADYKADYVAGAYIKRACTEFASYDHAWMPITQDVSTINEYINHGFGPGKAGRLIDIDVNPSDPGFLDVIMVPNYGPAAKAWWWWGGEGATAQNLRDICAGKAWATFKADGIKKRIVSLARHPSGSLVFVLNEVKGGDQVPYFGIGAGSGTINAICNGGAWGGIPSGPERRLVSVKLHAAPDNWTFLMVPRKGLGWHWWDRAPWSDIQQNCHDANRRIIHIERYGASEDRYTAIVVQNQ
jgi:hypothetical protein